MTALGEKPAPYPTRNLLSIHARISFEVPNHASDAYAIPSFSVYSLRINVDGLSLLRPSDSLTGATSDFVQLRLVSSVLLLQAPGDVMSEFQSGAPTPHLVRVEGTLSNCCDLRIQSAGGKLFSAAASIILAHPTAAACVQFIEQLCSCNSSTALSFFGPRAPSFCDNRIVSDDCSPCRSISDGLDQVPCLLQSKFETALERAVQVVDNLDVSKLYVSDFNSLLPSRSGKDQLLEKPFPTSIGAPLQNRSADGASKRGKTLPGAPRTPQQQRRLQRQGELDPLRPLCSPRPQLTPRSLVQRPRDPDEVPLRPLYSPRPQHTPRSSPTQKWAAPRDQSQVDELPMPPLQSPRPLLTPRSSKRAASGILEPSRALNCQPRDDTSNCALGGKTAPSSYQREEIHFVHVLVERKRDENILCGRLRTAGSSRSPYFSSQLQLDDKGIVLHGPTATGDFCFPGRGPWLIPHAAIAQVFSVKANDQVQLPPSSHPYLFRVHFSRHSRKDAHGRWASGSWTSMSGAKSMLQVSLTTAAERTQLVNLLKDLKRLHFERRCSSTAVAVRPPSAPGNALDSDDISEPRTPVADDARAATPPAMRSPERQLENKGDLVNPMLSKWLLNLRPDDFVQPVPIVSEEVWICISQTFSSFQRCSLCIDKLGLTVKPLVSSDQVVVSQEGDTILDAIFRGATFGRCDQDCELMTEAISFPISSIVDIVEDSQKTMDKLKPLDTDILGLRNPSLPFARAFELTSNRTEITLRRGGIDSRTPPKPPYPHVCGIFVKGTLCPMVRSRRKSQPEVETEQAPLLMAMCFSDIAACKRIVQKLLAYKKYVLSLALQSHMCSLVAGSLEKPECRKGHRLDYAKDCGFTGMSGQKIDGGSSLEIATDSGPEDPKEFDALLAPPPPPERPADLPPPHRLPHMMTNDQGEVFWHIPSRKKAKLQKPAKVGPDEADMRAPEHAVSRSLPGTTPLESPGRPGHLPPRLTPSFNNSDSVVIDIGDELGPSGSPCAELPSSNSAFLGTRSEVVPDTSNFRPGRHVGIPKRSAEGFAMV